jgi:hypothetical protein
MYVSSSHRYSQQRSSFYGSSSSNQSQSYSPSKYGNSYDDHHSPQHSSPAGNGRYYSPPLKSQNYQRGYGASSSAYGDYYNQTNNQYFHQEGTTFYHSSSSTASSSQDGYYADDLDDFDELRSAFNLRADADPDMTTVPTVPTPIALSLYEHGKTPSGRVVVTSSNQTIEFFSCAVNAPSRGVFVA